jgi:hypothetical protein
MTVSGNGTNLLISTPLITNALYSAVITIGDLGGDTATLSFSFDTIDTSYDYIFQAADFNYNNGLFLDNPQTNAYAGLLSHPGVDVNNPNGGPSLYRNSAYGLATEICGDLPSPAYYKTGYTNYDIPAADNLTGNWGNYTRTFPAGADNGPFLVYMRAASVGGQSDAASMYFTNGLATTATQSPTLLGTFSPPDTGGQQSYTWVPLIAPGGGRAIFVGGGVRTLRVTSDNGNYSVNSYLLIPVNTNLLTITNLYPNGTNMFQTSSSLSFGVESTAGVAAGNILLQLAGTNLYGQGFATNLTSANGLIVGGTSNNWSVSTSLSSNMVYTVSIHAPDASGLVLSTNFIFDTIIPYYTFEAEDYDFSGGQFVDNPQTNAYYGANGQSGAPGAIQGVDVYDGNPPGPGNFGPYNRDGLTVESCGDVLRAPYDNPLLTGFNDYDLGANATGNWANYTRTYPSGNYNIFIRGAGPSSPTTDNASLAVVTGGIGTSNQTTVELGTFTLPNTGNYQKYSWAPLKDIGGNPVVFSGGKQTLRVTVDGGNYNANFYLLMPVNTNVLTLGNFNPNGLYQLQYTNRFSFVAYSPVAINAGGISVQLSGTTLLGQSFVTNLNSGNGLTISGPANNPTVTAPLTSNVLYTAVIQVSDSSGSNVTASVSFDTLRPVLTFEAEDFNYGGGQFIDNPAVDAYSNLVAVVGIDTHDLTFNTNGQTAYRPNGLNTEVASDKPRLAYVVGFVDYDLAANASGNWGNYTRTFPAGVYNVYMRGASPVGLSDAASLSLVTNATSANQAVTLLGTFTIPVTGSYQAYTWVPLRDSDGNVAQFVGGAQKTLRVTVDGGNYNANYYMLTPADTTLPLNPPQVNIATSGSGVGGTMTFSFNALYGHTYYLDYKTNLTDTVWIQLRGPTAGAGLPGTFSDPISPGTRFYRLRVQ